jgi:hypothetical protein
MSMGKIVDIFGMDSGILGEAFTRPIDIKLKNKQRYKLALKELEEGKLETSYYEIDTTWNDKAIRFKDYPGYLYRSIPQYIDCEFIIGEGEVPGIREMHIKGLRLMIGDEK